MQEISKAIFKASGILQAAGTLDMRANEFDKGTARGRATAQAMRVVADELRDLAMNTRNNAEKLNGPSTSRR